MDRKDLKIQALKERIAGLTTEYEDKNADLRVELTLVSMERDDLRDRLAALEAANEVPAEESGTADDSE
jgi:hypothetical protein